MATVKKKVGVVGYKAQSSPQSVKPTLQEIHNFIQELPIVGNPKPRMRLGSHLKVLGMTHINGEKIRNKAQYLISAEQIAHEYHSKNIQKLMINPEFGWPMLKEYKSAAMEDYNKGINVKY